MSKLKIKKLYVHRDQYDRDQYYLSNDRDIKFDSLKDLIIHNKVRFKMPLDDNEESTTTSNTNNDIEESEYLKPKDLYGTDEEVLVMCILPSM